MKVHKIDHVGIVVNDLAAAKAFFLDFGLELQGEGIVEGIRLARGIARSGENIRAIWEKDWMIAEDLYKEEQRPDERADLVIDSSGEIPHDLEQEYIVVTRVNGKPFSARNVNLAHPW